MDLTDKKLLKDALSLAGLKPTKKLGQHFLVDRTVLDNIISTAKIEASDTVLEIGPGVGTLTSFLVDRVACVVAVEKDYRFVEILRRQFPNSSIVHQDFMNYDLSGLEGYKVVANLPYYITSNILRRLLATEPKPRSITVLIQKEVAERITASAGAMSLLAFSVQYFGKPAISAVVPKTSFWPTPEVDSAILHIEVYDQAVFEADVRKLFKLVKAGFGEKRKMLKNALAGGLAIKTSQSMKMLLMADLATSARAQELAMDDWCRLYNAAVDLGYI